MVYFEPLINRLKLFPPCPLLALSQFTLSLVFPLVWHCLKDGLIFLLSISFLKSIACPSVVLLCGFWSPVSVGGLFSSLFDHVFPMLSGFLFSVEWFYLLLFLMFWSCFFWSLFVWALSCRLIFIYHSSRKKVSFWLTYLIYFHMVVNSILD